MGQSERSIKQKDPSQSRCLAHLTADTPNISHRSSAGVLLLGKVTIRRYIKRFYVRMGSRGYLNVVGGGILVDAHKREKE